MPELKTCPDCQTAKPLDDFHRHKGTRDGRTTYCKVCVNARSKRWREQNRERYADSYRDWSSRNRDGLRRKKRNAAYLREYGITLDQFEEMLASQDGRCAICRTLPTDEAVFAVDHAHDTGMVRGLLCGPCNRALGLFADDPARLQAAISYLNR